MKRKTISMFAWMMMMALSLPVTACAKDALTEEEALARIEQLPEVHSFIVQIAQSKSGVKPIIRLEEDVGGDRDVFQFYVGESHPTHTAVWNRFVVNRKNGAIMVLDIDTGDFIPLNRWREKKLRPR